MSAPGDAYGTPPRDREEYRDDKGYDDRGYDDGRGYCERGDGRRDRGRRRKRGDWLEDLFDFG